ncbi:hypothetical protein BDZ94DRAFT_1306999 [Collybia nuda]|uniref:deuterolysin n=1 Tax=Collybia nuda TaxID=64659 RepID=A0A9P5YBH9_9AGAR|nr:hypothetical protein BDZ94DRAFT_1306999 [Collybia nuda]
MFRSTILLSFVAVALGLSAGDLKVSVKAISSSVDSVDDIVISAIVTNPTKEDIRVISKNNILDPTATKSFAVSKQGDELLFSGIRATYDFNAAGVYTTIPAGGSVAVNHTGLGALYDFEAAGTGTFSFSASTHFQTGPDAPIIEANTAPVDVTVKKDVKKRSFIPLERRLSTPTCGDGGRKQVITDSLTYARSLAGGAATDIRTHPNSAEFNTYFGGNSQDDIWYRHDIIAGDLSSSGTRIDPAGICGGSGGVIAYTLVVTSGGNIVGSDIYTCDIFFTSVGTTPSICSGGFDSTTSSRGGVILHELSHATSGTSDLGYGCSVTAGLSVANKRNNADNYRCMGLAIYKHYNC